MVLKEVEDNDDSTVIKSLNALSQTCQGLHQELNPALYKTYGKQALEFAAEKGNAETFLKILAFAPEIVEIEHVSAFMKPSNSTLALKILHHPTIHALLLCSDPCYSPIFAAVMYGQVELIDYITAVQPVKHHTFDSQKRQTMLHYACEMGHLGLVRRFLNEGADPTQPNIRLFGHDTPMHLLLAIRPQHPGRERLGNIEIVREILQRFPDLAQDNQYLMGAIEAGREDMLALLLDNGARIPQCEQLKRKALINAIKAESLAIIKLLLEHGASVGTKVPKGTSLDLDPNDDDGAPLYETAGLDGENGIKIAKLLISYGADVTKPLGSNPSRTPLWRAVVKDNIAFATFLLDRGAARYNESHVDAPDVFYIKSMRMLRLLLDYGFDINAHARNGYLPIQNMARMWLHDRDFDDGQKQARFEVFEHFVKNAEDINAKSLIDETVCMVCHDTQMLRLLLDNGCDVNAVDYQGRNALHYALNTALETGMGRAQLLLAHGADVDAQDTEGVYSFYIPVDWVRDTDVVRQLVDMYIHAKAEQSGHINHASRADIRSFLHRKGFGGMTALIHGIALHPSWGQHDLAIFLELGADVNEPDTRGNTPLMTAMRYRRFEQANYLVQQGANVNAINGSGRTMLDLAIMFLGEAAALLHVPEHWGALRANELLQG
jgi:ankyrin repeat protein